jgi:hypothetical protein
MPDTLEKTETLPATIDVPVASTFTRSEPMARVLAFFDGLTPESPVEDMVKAAGVESILKEFAKCITVIRKKKFVEWIEQNGREIIIGSTKCYVGSETTTKCNSVPQAAEAIFLAVGGDIEAFKNCLASDAFKPGACKKILADEFNKYFTVTVKPKLDEKGMDVSARQLIEINLDFVR